MATLATTPRTSQGWLPHMRQSNAYGISAREIGSEIDRITEHAVHTLLRKNPGMGTIFVDLRELVEGELEDEYGILRPTKYAIRKVLELLVNAGLQGQKRVPYGTPSTDDEGGLRIEWHWQERDLRLVVPGSAGGRCYIYHELGNDYDLETPVDAITLAKWLDWLSNV